MFGGDLETKRKFHRLFLYVVVGRGGGAGGGLMATVRARRDSDSLSSLSIPHARPPSKCRQGRPDPTCSEPRRSRARALPGAGPSVEGLRLTGVSTPFRGLRKPSASMGTCRCAARPRGRPPRLQKGGRSGARRDGDERGTRPPDRPGRGLGENGRGKSLAAVAKMA